MAREASQEPTGIDVKEREVSPTHFSPGDPRETPLLVAERLLQQVTKKARRRKKMTGFYRRTYAEALAFAKRFLPRQEDAEDAVAEAFCRLLMDKTTPDLFFRSLKFVAIDRYRRLDRESRIFFHGAGPFERQLPPELASVEAGPGAAMRAARLADSSADPLEILLNEESIEVGIQLVQTRSEHRWIRQLNWWTELVEQRGMA